MRYDLKCECGWKEDDLILTVDEMEGYLCPSCGQPTRVNFENLGAVPVHAFKEGFYTHLTGPDEKIWFTSKEQLAREAHKRGKYSDYADFDPPKEI